MTVTKLQDGSVRIEIDGKEMIFGPILGRGYKEERKRYKCVDCDFESNETWSYYIHGISHPNHRIGKNF